MRRISKSAYADVLLWGCHPGVIPTDDGVLLIDTPRQPTDAQVANVNRQDVGNLYRRIVARRNAQL